MAFFDNLGKKASEFTAKAVQKTQELSETARLNGLVAEEEKKITNTYYQIGKLYASIHGSKREDSFVGMLDVIAEAEVKISDYRKQIQDIKGVLRCENCGAEVAKGVAFCSSCGTPMPKQEAPVPDNCVKCTNCGTLVKAGMRFCTACGTSMVQTPAVECAAPTPAAAEAPERCCPNCGAKADADTVFCTECGTKI